MGDEKRPRCGVLCGDPRAVLEQIAAELFPEASQRVMGGALVQRARELAINAARLEVVLQVCRYPPPTVDDKTGHVWDAVERVERLTVEHTALVDHWSESTRELAAARRERAEAKRRAAEDAA